MLSSQSDLFQEPSCDDCHHGLFNESSVQYLSNHNQSFFSQQSSTSSQDRCPSYLLSDETVPIRKEQTNQQLCQQNLKVPQQLFMKNQQNKMVILSKKNMKKQVEMNSNTSLTLLGCNLGTQETGESDDNKSESADESVKRSSYDNFQVSLGEEDEDDTNCFQLKKKFISPRAVHKLNIEKTQQKQTQLDLALSSYIPQNYKNTKYFTSYNRNPRLNRLKKINNNLDLQIQANTRNLSLNERINTEPVASRSNTPIREKPTSVKRQVIQSNLFQNCSNSINGSYLKQNPQQIEQQFENEKRRIQTHNLRSNSLANQEKIPSSLLQKEIDNLFQTPSSQKLKTESGLETRKNSQNSPILLNRQMLSPMRKRPLLQPVKIQSRVDYEKEAMELIKYYDCKQTQQQSFSESPVKSKLISPVKPNKKFTESLFKLSNQITELEKSMLSSYYKDFIRITPF